MSLVSISIFIALSSSMLLFISPSLPLQTLALLLITTATSSLIATNISILIGIYTILIYASGLLVLLAYFVALSPDQTLNTPSRFTLLTLATLIIFLLSQGIFYSSSTHTSSEEGAIAVITILTPSSSALLSLVALTLVLTIVAIINITSLSSGPVRQWSA